MQNSRKFIFSGYEPDIKKGTIYFHYKIESDIEPINFTEKISFPPADNKIPPDLLKSLLDNLMLILGISYWKIYCPKTIELKGVSLTKDQARFWNTVYTKGLGEFFYKNNVDFRGLINFPFNEKAVQASIDFPRKDRILLGVGGGKDSIVAAELLKTENKQVDLATSGFPIQIEIAEMISGNVINTFRQIDPKLLRLNKEKGTYNGHIPISAYYAFLLVLMAALFDYKYVVVGNEKSANYGNMEYLGEMINHQWSKSEEFEKLFSNYVKKFITSDITYSSPIRSMTELQVVKEFVKYPKYFQVFSSCNRNYRINNQSDRKWCGECPKCLFVFICLAAFLPKQEVLAIFSKNLLDDKSLLPLFEELIGFKNFKPFECVGTPKEVKEALNKISKKGEFDETILMESVKNL